MNKIDDLIKQYCPNGVKYKELGEIVNILDNQRRPVAKEKRKKGNIPYYGANGIQDWVDDCIFDGTFLLVGEDGSVINKDNTPVLNWATGKIWVNNHAHILSEKIEEANLRYIYFILSKTDVSSIVRGVPPKLNQMNLKGIKIPVPPMPVQEEIVGVLDAFTALEAELEAELEARKRQYEYYRNKLLTFDENTTGGGGIKFMQLGKVGNICMCKRIMKHQTNRIGGVPFYKIGTFGKRADSFISKEVYDDYKRRYSFPKKGDVLISASGTIGRTVVYDGEPAYFQDSNIVWLDNDETQILNTFLHYLYQKIEWKTQGGTIQRLYNENIRKIVIPVPPIEEQERIVAILDKFDSLVNDISEGLPAELTARRQQYEYYRNKLLAFTPLASEMN